MPNNIQADRFDTNKIKMSAIPPQFLAALAMHCNVNQIKYPDKNGRPNWTYGMPYSKMIDAMERHLLQFKDGQSHDYETVPGTNYNAHHLIAMAWACMALYWYELNPDDYHEFDDRMWATCQISTTYDLERKKDE